MTPLEHRLAWPGTHLFSYGFRPFFLGASIWAVVAMGFWLGMLSGQVNLPLSVDPVSWHAHAFLFGYFSAVVAGFLLTAVPNWTGRAPIAGWPLVGLFALWVIGRLASLVSGLLPPLLFAVLDTAMPVVLAGLLLSEIVIARNWKNLIVLGLLAALITGNLLFHASLHDVASTGLRLELVASVLMVAVIGGRVVPAFTRNWLAQQGRNERPAPMGRFDQASLLALLVTLLLWLLLPANVPVLLALVAAGAIHLLRLSRWKGWLTTREPLVFILHLGYLCVPLGALLIGLSGVTNGWMSAAAAQHVWMAGMIGIMTLAIMTRASLGHTGHDLHAGPGTLGIYAAVIVSVVARVLADLIAPIADELLALSGLTWIAAFAGFAVLYGPLLTRARTTV